MSKHTDKATFLLTEKIVTKILQNLRTQFHFVMLEIKHPFKMTLGTSPRPEMCFPPILSMLFQNPLSLQHYSYPYLKNKTSRITNLTREWQLLLLSEKGKAIFLLHCLFLSSVTKHRYFTLSVPLFLLLLPLNLCWLGNTTAVSDYRAVVNSLPASNSFKGSSSLQ